MAIAGKISKEIRSWSFFPVLMTYFIDSFGLAIVFPIFTPLFLSPHATFMRADFSLFQRTLFLGLMIASFPLAQIIGAPLFGALSDRFGRKKIYLFTLTGGIVGYFLTGLGIHIQEIHLLWSGRILAGFFAGNLTLCLAAITDVSHEKEERNRNFGLVGTIGGLGFVFALLLGGSFSDTKLDPFFHPELPFLFTCLLLFLNLILMLALFKESRTIKPHDKFEFIKGFKNIWKVLHIKGARIIYVVYFLFMISWYTSMQFLSAYLLDTYATTTKTVITITFALIALTWSLANFVLHPLLTRIFSSHKIFQFSLTFVGIFFFFSLIPHQPRFLFLTHFFLATLFAALAWTNGFATLSLAGPKKIQGSLLGVNQSIMATALIVGPLVGSLLAGIDIHKLYFFTACCAFAAAFLFSRKD